MPGGPQAVDQRLMDAIKAIKVALFAFCVLFYYAALVAALLALFWFYDGLRPARAQQDYLLSWIPATCCVTNECCWQIQESELRSLPDDNWEVRSTGQVRKRTDYSPDGKFYRCACDFDSESRQWVRHQGANTRCIFVPMRSSHLNPRNNR